MWFTHWYLNILVSCPSSTRHNFHRLLAANGKSSSPIIEKGCSSMVRSRKLVQCMFHSRPICRHCLQMAEVCNFHAPHTITMIKELNSLRCHGPRNCQREGQICQPFTLTKNTHSSIAGKFCNLAFSESTLERDILAELWRYDVVYRYDFLRPKKTVLSRWERSEMDAISMATNTGHVETVCVPLAPYRYVVFCGFCSTI